MSDKIKQINVNGKVYDIQTENDHTHSNKDVLDKIVNINDNKQYVIKNGALQEASFPFAHFHNNKDTLDNIEDVLNKKLENIPDNSIATKNIQDNAVTKEKIPQYEIPISHIDMSAVASGLYFKDPEADKKAFRTLNADLGITVGYKKGDKNVSTYTDMSRSSMGVNFKRNNNNCYCSINTGGLLYRNDKSGTMMTIGDNFRTDTPVGMSFYNPKYGTHNLIHKLDKSDFDEFKANAATNLTNGEGENSIKSIGAIRAVTDSSVALGRGTVAGSKALEITGVTADNDTKTSTLTVKLSELTDEELVMFDTLKEGDKCCVRTSNEYDYIDIVSTDKTNCAIVVKAVVSGVKDDDYTNYISFVDYPLLGTTYEKTPFAYADGENTMATARASRAEGRDTKAIGQYGHSEGRDTIAGYASHAEGRNTQAISDMSHSEGNGTRATAHTAHAEGAKTQANGVSSHAEGQNTQANGQGSHAEGYLSQANATFSHAEGVNTKANNIAAHSEGHGTVSAGTAAHSEGQNTQANGYCSHSEGMGTIANGKHQHVEGHFNTLDDNNKYVHIVGNGTSSDNRSNAHTLDWNGNAWYAGTVEATAIILKSSTAGSNKRFKITVDDNGTLSAVAI